MPKVTLDRETFKALASDTRLDILRALDGKSMSLNDICRATNLNKATLHEHLTKLSEVGLIKKNEREGHKWVYYRLSWKGECLLHPENSRIVVLFSITFISLFVGIIQLINFARGKVVGLASTFGGSSTIHMYAAEGDYINLAINSGLRYLGDLPAQNQTLSKLSMFLNKNIQIRNILGQQVNYSDIKWDAVYPAKQVSVTADALLRGESLADSSNAQAMVAFIQDPVLLYIAIGCIVLFMVLFSIGIWRLWENKTQKI
ncbi:MAG: winged helix-turn-helix domain-containing protein [Candidatus Thermoplasmatota archaeon]|jgi:DNA-binding transcriptional ArsR family regulator|nr:winged helix-turn-helix domain-containing protein [Candidatus Thermoplasmatota archaeon]